MKTITLTDFLDNPKLQKEVKRTLENGGLVCLPCNGKYRIVADLDDTAAVMRLFQTKRRVRKAPALVFVGHQNMLPMVSDDVDPVARALADAVWPGPLTLLVSTNKNLPRKITKQIDGGSTNKVGVRVPESDWLKVMIQSIGRPLLVSSANRERKGGEASPAQIRKNFSRELDLFIDAGELSAATSSTVVEIDDGRVNVVRAGTLDESFIQECVAAL